MVTPKGSEIPEGLMNNPIFVAILYIISKNTQISNLMKIRPVGAEFFRADGPLSNILRVFLLPPEKYQCIILDFKHLLVHTTYEDGKECSETSAYKIQTPGNYPKESIQPACYIY
jgi:hypothetical protein